MRGDLTRPPLCCTLQALGCVSQKKKKESLEKVIKLIFSKKQECSVLEKSIITTSSVYTVLMHVNIQQKGFMLLLHYKCWDHITHQLPTIKLKNRKKNLHIRSWNGISPNNLNTHTHTGITGQKHIHGWLLSLPVWLDFFLCSTPNFSILLSWAFVRALTSNSVNLSWWQLLTQQDSWRALPAFPPLECP